MKMEILTDTIKLGDFTLSSGIKSDHYFDLRELISKPESLCVILELIAEKEETSFADCNLVCGVPIGGIPLASAYSIIYNIPQIILRKEAKKHGTAKDIEGIWKKGDKVLLLDDVWTTGASMNNAKQKLESYGLDVEMAVILWRSRYVPPKNVQCLFHEDEILDAPIVKFKRHLSDKGKLCFAADCSFFINIFAHADRLRDKISVLKLHPDIVADWSKTAVAKLINLGEKYNVKLWVDLKLCDISHVMIEQMRQYKWADLISVMSIVGEDTIGRLEEEANEHDIDLILVNSLSSNGGRIWTDDRDFSEIKWTRVVGNVGDPIQGLVHIAAGVGDEDPECDLIVRGRSLMI